MTRHPSQDRGYPYLIRITAQILATYPDRYTRALEVMADARSPLRANSYETNIGGHTTPNPGQTAIAHQATHDRKDLHDTFDKAFGLLRHAGKLLDEWAPQPPKYIGNFWCENHANHGHQVARADDGSRNCDWCCTVNRKWGTLPTRKLIDLHERGRRITETEYRKLLGKGAA
jgi:hypothetical protein